MGKDKQASDHLSEHFRLSEFLKSASHPDLVPRPENVPQRVQANLMTLAQAVLEPIREQFKVYVVVTSGYRPPSLNKAVGGSPTSQHLIGQAADIEIHGAELTDVFLWLGLSGLDFGQVILYLTASGRPRFLHVSLPGARYRRRCFVNIDGRQSEVQPGEVRW